MSKSETVQDSLNDWVPGDQEPWPPQIQQFHLAGDVKARENTATSGKGSIALGRSATILRDHWPVITFDDRLLKADDNVHIGTIGCPRWTDLTSLIVSENVARRYLIDEELRGAFARQVRNTLRKNEVLTGALIIYKPFEKDIEQRGPSTAVGFICFGDTPGASVEIINAILGRNAVMLNSYIQYDGMLVTSFKPEAEDVRKPLKVDANQRADMSPAAVSTIAEICKLLECSPEQRVRILTNLDEQLAADWFASEQPVLDNVSLERASLFLGVWQGLTTMFGDDDYRIRWLKAENSDAPFNGRVPLDLLTSPDIDDLWNVRNYIDRWKAGAH